MPITDSPLRYPGGKTKIYAKVKETMDSVLDKEGRIYIEPYAGGAGLALKLLFKNNVERVILNDIDYHIFCFWNECLNDTEALCDKIEHTNVDIQEWIEQKKIYKDCQLYSKLEVGFSTFFLNRCNVSGIINGGPIGGYGQKGKYKINARYNKENLIKKIRKVALYKDKIVLFNMDAVDFLSNVIPLYNPKNVFLNIDPPYVNKGPMLYKNSYTQTDHECVAEQVKKLQTYWIVTYDACELISKLYDGFIIEGLELSYSAGKQKVGNEYIIYSKRIKETTND